MVIGPKPSDGNFRFPATRPLWMRTTRPRPRAQVHHPGV